MAKECLDKLIVALGLAETRERARAAIMAGLVSVNGEISDKPGHTVAEDARVELKGKEHPYVSRGGMKLEGALKAFALEVTGLTALDIGASTGGFTDCLLQRGARCVYAVDVGRGQLDQRLRDDLRVTNIEGLNARNLLLSDVPGAVDFVCIDVAFISLTKILPQVPPLLSSGALAVLAMVKPQFEAGPQAVGRRGVVRDPAVRTDCVARIADVADELGLAPMAVAASPILGPKGNAEFFLHLRPNAQRSLTREEIEASVASMERDAPN